jgi:hypothetical protein
MINMMKIMYVVRDLVGSAMLDACVLSLYSQLGAGATM